MLRLCIMESYVGGLTELKETFEINLTAGKLFVTKTHDQTHDSGLPFVKKSFEREGAVLYI